MRETFLNQIRIEQLSVTTVYSNVSPSEKRKRKRLLIVSKLVLGKAFWMRPLEVNIITLGTGRVRDLGGSGYY